MKILVIQSAFLGDIVLATPVISSLKLSFPEAQIYFLTTPAGASLIQNNPDITECLIFDKQGKDRGILGLWRQAQKLKTYNFDRIYSLHKSFRTSFLMALLPKPLKIGFRNAKFSFVYNHRQPYIGEHQVLRNLQLLSSLENPIIDQNLKIIPNNKNLGKFDLPIKYIVVAASSAWETKRWSAENFNQLCLKLEKNGWQIVLTGSANEIEIINKVAVGTTAINLAGKTSLAETIAILSNAALLVCNDSMILHLASALKIPTVAIFCATSPKFGFGPWKTPHRIVELQGLSCKPCSPHGARICPTGTNACMKDLKADLVFSAIKELLEEETREERIVKY